LHYAKKNTSTELLMGYVAQGLLVLMRKKPFADISIKEIAEKAGVNRSTYYRHFNSKEDVLRFYFGKILHEYEAVLDKALSYKNHLQKLLSHYLKYKKELLSIYKNDLAHIILDVLNGYFLGISENKDISFEEKYRIYWHTGGIYNTFLLWFSSGMKESPERMSEMYNTIIADKNDREFLRKPFLLV